MNEGTSLPRFKAAYIALLQGRMDNVIYGSPVSPEDVLGENGTGVAAWWSDDTEAVLETNVMVAGDKWFDETITTTLILQAIGRDTDTDAEVLDALCSAALYHAIGILASDPGVGIADDTEIQTFQALPVGWKYPTGLLGAQRAGRFELDIQIEARLKLT